MSRAESRPASRPAGPLNGKRILIATASNWPSTAALPRLFGRGGAHVTVLCHRGALIRLSRYTNAAVDVEGGLAKTVETLRTHLASNAYDAVIAGDDPLVAELLREPDRQWLEPWFPFGPDDAKAIGFATSKHEFLRVSAAAGLPVAEFAICTSLGDFESAAQRFGYPFVAKAATGHAGGTVHRVADAAGARAIWERYGGAPLAAQRFVRGRVATIEVLWDHGVPRCFVGAHKVDCHPSDFGAASAKQPFRHPELETIARLVGSITGYHGIGAIDVIYDEDAGRFLVLELNPRPSGGGFTLGTSIAMGFYRAYRALLDREPLTAPENLGYDGSPVFLYPNNWYYFVELADKTRPRAWVRAAKTLFNGPIDDPKLLVKYIRVFVGYYAERSAIGKKLKKSVKRAFRLSSIPHPGAR